eukprot:315055-Karenia_brevis.AAC.1
MREFSGCCRNPSVLTLLSCQRCMGQRRNLDLRKFYHKFKFFFSQHPNPGSGGVAILVSKEVVRQCCHGVHRGDIIPGRALL